MPLPVFRLIVFALALLASGCEQKPSRQGPEYGSAPLAQPAPTYHLAIHPLHNPIKLQHDYQPLIEYLNDQVQNARLELESSRDYGNFEEKFRARRPEFLLPNPWQTLEAMKAGYAVIAMAGQPEDFKGLFLVRRDSGIKTPADLKGKAVSYPSPTALAACIMPQYFLYEHGLKVNTEIENRYVGSQESSIMNVHLKLTAAGATWPPPWRAFQKEHPREAAELQVIWETPSLINNSVMARDDVPPQVREQVRLALLRLQDTPAGRAILAGMETNRFLPAADADYEIVRQYIARFEQKVRPVELKR